jgi:hypothetical protein
LTEEALKKIRSALQDIKVHAATSSDRNAGDRIFKRAVEIEKLLR